MDVDLLLGTEQALMLYSISTDNIIPCIYDSAVVINVYLVAFADEGVGHSDQRAQWQSCRSCACHGSRYSKTLASLTVLVSIDTVHVLHCSYIMKRKPRLHDGIVTIDLGKNRRHQMMDSQGSADQQAPKMQPLPAKKNATCVCM